MNKFKFEPQYIIEMECIDEGNSFGLKIGDKVYAAGWDGSDYSSDINHASLAFDIEYAKEVAKRIYKNGDFYPRIRNIVRYIGNSINVNFDE